MFGYQLLLMAVDRWAQLDTAAETFRRETGVMVDQMKDLWISVKDISRDFAKFGVTIESAYKAASSLLTTFNVIEATNKANLEYITLMHENLGVGEATATRVLQKFAGISKLSAQGAKNLTIAVAEFAKKSGVAFKTIIEDIEKITGYTIGLFRGSAQQMAMAAVQARRMGISLSDATKSAESLMDFTSSVNKEMEASVLLGTAVNLQRLRELAYRGNINGMIKEQSRLFKELGGLQGKDYFQIKAMADAMGMSVDSLVAMEAQEKLLRDARAEGAGYLVDQFEAAKELNDVEGKSATERLKKQLLQQQMQSKQNQLANRLKEIWVSLADVLVPVVDSIAGIFTSIAPVVTYLVKPFVWLADALQWIQTNTNKWVTGLAGILALLLVTKTNFLGLGFIISSITKLIFSGAVGLVGWIKNLSIIKSLSAAISASSAAGGTAGGGVAGAASSTAATLGNPAFMKNVLMASVAIAILAGALWIAGEAFKKFTGIDWEGVAKGVLILSLFGVLAAVLSSVATPMLIASAGFIALGLALLVAAVAFERMAPTMKPLGEGLGFIADGLKKLWPYLLGGNFLAIGAIGLAGAITAIGLSSWLWAGKISKLADALAKVASTGDGIVKVKDAVKELSAAISDLSKQENRGIKLEKTVKQISDVEVTPKLSTTKENIIQQTNDNSEKLGGILMAVNKLNENLTSGKVAVYIDGQRIDDVLKRSLANFGSMNKAGKDTISGREFARA
jgi:hypothetical protein